MTRKHYQIIGAAMREAIYEAEPGAPREAVEYAAKRLAGSLAQDNPRFDSARFLAACGVN